MNRVTILRMKTIDSSNTFEQSEERNKAFLISSLQSLSNELSPTLQFLIYPHAAGLKVKE
jgi:hypothetical protein